jgi:hypothetical protein
MRMPSGTRTRGNLHELAVARPQVLLGSSRLREGKPIDAREDALAKNRCSAEALVFVIAKRLQYQPMSDTSRPRVNCEMVTAKIKAAPLNTFVTQSGIPSIESPVIPVPRK